MFPVRLLVGIDQHGQLFLLFLKKVNNFHVVTICVTALLADICLYKNKKIVKYHLSTTVNHIFRLLPF